MSNREKALKIYFWQTLRANLNSMYYNIFVCIEIIKTLIACILICVFSIYAIFGFAMGIAHSIFYIFSIEKKCSKGDFPCDLMSYYIDNGIGLQCLVIFFNAFYILCMEEHCSFCKNKKKNEKCKNYIHLSEFGLIFYIFTNFILLELINSPLVFSFPTYIWVIFIFCYQAKFITEKAKNELLLIENSLNDMQEILKQMKDDVNLIKEEINDLIEEENNKKVIF